MRAICALSTSLRLGSRENVMVTIFLPLRNMSCLLTGIQKAFSPAYCTSRIESTRTAPRRESMKPQTDGLPAFCSCTFSTVPLAMVLISSTLRISQALGTSAKAGAATNARAMNARVFFMPLVYRPTPGEIEDGARGKRAFLGAKPRHEGSCLLYTSDAADERSSVDLGGRR